MTAALATTEAFDSAHLAGAGRVGAVVFDGCLGQLHSADGRTGVLMCSPWGYEELCARRSWRRLAEAIAATGSPCLRFDYPGTGDSLDRADVDLDTWVASAVAAASALRQSTGVERLILLGQGLGATVASLAASRIPDVSGLVLMAPVTTGRLHLRELAMWGAMVASTIRLPVSAEMSQGVGVAGFSLAPAVATELKRLDLLAAPPTVTEALIVGRPAAPQDAQLAAALEAHGAQVGQIAYDGYDALLTDPTMAVTPTAVIDQVAAWVGARTRRDPGPDRPRPRGVLAGPGFTESPVRFGAGAELFGVYCMPEGERRGAIVLMLNSGLDPHTGWARCWVDQARALAAEGIASMRIDAAGIGDSPSRPGAPEQTLYSDAQLADVRAAVDWLDPLGPVVIAGRCSGAYLGLDAAVADPRVSGLVMVNPLRLVWRPGESVDEAIRSASLNHYRARILQAETFARIMRGEVAVGRLAMRLFRRVFATVAAGERAHGQLRARAHAKFAALRARRVPISLVYSDGDDGLVELATWFGKDGHALAAFPNVTRTSIPDADHNLTPPAARARLFEIVRAAALGAPQ